MRSYTSIVSERERVVTIPCTIPCTPTPPPDAEHARPPPHTLRGPTGAQGARPGEAAGGGTCQQKVNPEETAFKHCMWRALSLSLSFAPDAHDLATHGPQPRHTHEEAALSPPGGCRYAEEPLPN